LNEARIRAAKPKDKPYTLRDGRGLHLLVTPTGAVGWEIALTDLAKRRRHCLEEH
jgi:hypothetical protein